MCVGVCDWERERERWKKEGDDVTFAVSVSYFTA